MNALMDDFNIFVVIFFSMDSILTFDESSLAAVSMETFEIIIK